MRPASQEGVSRIDLPKQVNVQCEHADTDGNGCHPDCLWSDWRTTYRLLPVGHGPDKPVEGAVRCWAQIKVGPDCLQDLWVGLRQTLCMGLQGQLLGHVLMQETQNITFFLA